MVKLTMVMLLCLLVSCAVRPPPQAAPIPPPPPDGPVCQPRTILGCPLSDAELNQCLD